VTGPTQRAAPAAALRETTRRGPFVLALLAACVWTAGLALLAWRTANPDFVSPDQVRASDVVVEAALAGANLDRVVVKRVFKGQVSTGDELRVLNLREASLPTAGGTWILPLTRFRQDFEVTLLNQQAAATRPLPVLVYAANAATRAQAQKLSR
jgi:hypothetical protein